jgi:glycosyltransferase involved in cell wall biosynthesis
MQLMINKKLTFTCFALGLVSLRFRVRKDLYMQYSDRVPQGSKPKVAKKLAERPAIPDGRLAGAKRVTLTIVIPAYNEQRHLGSCLDSIAAQVTRADEVIVVDNNSTDLTCEIAKKYPFVKLLKEKNQGIVFARNLGFNAAKSDLIGRIDADTILSEDWVQKDKNHYREVGCSVFYAATGPSAFQNSKTHHLWYPLHRIFYFWSSRVLMGHNTLSGSNMFMTNALWQRVQSNVCLRTDIHEDMDLALHINRLGVDVNFIKNAKNSMAGRKVLYKLKNYPSMWLKIKLVEHGG